MIDMIEYHLSTNRFREQNFSTTLVDGRLNLGAMRKQLLCALLTILAAFTSSLRGGSKCRTLFRKIANYFSKNQNQVVGQNAEELHFNRERLEQRNLANNLQISHETLSNIDEKTKKSTQMQDEKTIDLAKFDELKKIQDKLNALVAKLHAIQNFQQIADQKQMNSSSDFIDSKAETLKRERIDNIYSELRNAQKVFDANSKHQQILDLFVENSSLTSAWEYRIGNLFEIIAEKTFEDFCVALNNCDSCHKIAFSERDYLLDCGHWKCFYCLKKITTTYYNVTYSKLKCYRCKTDSPFRVEKYLEAHSVNSKNEPDEKKPIELHFYIYSNTFRYKRCPKLSCDCVIKIEGIESDASGVYSELQCSKNHKFCAFCSTSFNHTPLTCLELRKMSSEDNLLWDERFLVGFANESTHVECEKCDRRMMRVDNSEIIGKYLRSVIEDSSLYVCTACKNIMAVETTASNSVFYKTLLLSQSLQNTKENLLSSAGQILRNSSLFLLCVVMLVNENYFLKFSKSIQLALKKNVQGYVALFKIALDWYVSLVEEDRSKQSNTTINQLNEASNKLQAIVLFHTKIFEHIQFNFNTIPNFFDLETPKKFSAYSFLRKISGKKALERLASCFVESTLYTPIQTLSFESLPSGEDPLQKVVDEIKAQFSQNEDLKKRTYKFLSRDLTVSDFNGIASEFELDSNKFFRSLEQDGSAKVMKRCGIVLARECAVCLLPFKPEPYGWADCGHDTYCEKCFQRMLTVQISEARWDKQTNLIRCFVEKCHGFLYVGVIRSVLGENSSLWKTYNQNLLRQLTIALNKDTIVQCHDCKKTFDCAEPSADKGVKDVFGSFARELRMSLKTFWCPGCAQLKCANCQTTELHYSTTCGKSTDVDAAFAMTCCPGCKLFGARESACPSMKCEKCKCDFCFACGVAPFFDAETCINNSYPSESYSSEADIKKIDAYHGVMRYALQAPLVAYHEQRKAIKKTIDNLPRFAGSTFDPLISVLQNILHFNNWHRLLPLFIEDNQREAKSSKIEKVLEEIEYHAKFALSFYSKQRFNDCMAACDLALTVMGSLDALIKKLKVSNKVVLNKAQVKDFEARLKRRN